MKSIFDGIKCDVEITGKIVLDIKIDQEEWEQLNIRDKKKLISFMSDTHI